MASYGRLRTHHQHHHQHHHRYHHHLIQYYQFGLKYNKKFLFPSNLTSKLFHFHIRTYCKNSVFNNSKCFTLPSSLLLPQFSQPLLSQHQLPHPQNWPFATVSPGSVQRAICILATAPPATWAVHFTPSPTYAKSKSISSTATVVRDAATITTAPTDSSAAIQIRRFATPRRPLARLKTVRRQLPSRLCPASLVLMRVPTSLPKLARRVSLAAHTIPITIATALKSISRESAQMG
jgi:hypothetical protein